MLFVIPRSGSSARSPYNAISNGSRRRKFVAAVGSGGRVPGPRPARLAPRVLPRAALPVDSTWKESPLAETRTSAVHAAGWGAGAPASRSGTNPAGGSPGNRSSTMPSYSRRAKLGAVRRTCPEHIESARSELAEPVATRSGMPTPPATPRTIDLQLAAPEGLSDQARKHFADCIRRFAADLDRKASGVEDAERAPGIDDPEITTTMVDKANEQLRNPPGVDTPLRRIAVFAAFAFAMFTPIAGEYLHSRSQWLLMIVSGFIALLAEVYAIVMPGRKWS
jgi:hypothetical protein